MGMHYSRYISSSESLLGDIMLPLIKFAPLVTAGDVSINGIGYDEFILETEFFNTLLMNSVNTIKILYFSHISCIFKISICTLLHKSPEDLMKDSLVKNIPE